MWRSYVNWLVVSTILFSVAGWAQPGPDLLWSRNFSWSALEYGFGICAIDDGGYVLACGSSSDREIVWLSSEGDTLRTRSAPGSAFRIIQVSDGIIVAGNSLFHPYLKKFSMVGDSIWYHEYTSVNTESGSDVNVKSTADGGFVMCTWDSDMILLRIDSNGELIWNRHYGGPNDEEAYALAETPDGGFLLGGGTKSYGGSSFYFNAYVVKTDAIGDTIWTRMWASDIDDVIYGISFTESGDYLLTGKLSLSSLLIRVNAEGSVLWLRNWDIQQRIGEALFCQEVGDGDIIVAGNGIDWSGGANSQVYLMRTDSQGMWRWYRLYGDGDSNVCSDAAITTDGGYAVVGWSFNINNPGIRISVYRTGPDQTSDADGRGVITVSCQVLGIYPNPFNATTSISYDLPKPGVVSLRVFDVTGREVAILQDGFNHAGTHQVAFDANNLASGVYFVKMDNGTFSQTKKLMLLK